MMKSSLLNASLFSILGAGVSTVALAQPNTNNLAQDASTFCKPGFYVGLEGGRGDTFYNSHDVFKQAISQDSGPSSASSIQNITDGQSTISTANSWSSTHLYSQQVDDTGLAGRLFAGYQFTPYFALETGYTQFNKTDFNAKGNTTTYITSAVNNVQTLNGGQAVAPQNTSQTVDVVNNSYTGDLTEHAVDLVGKLTLPLQHGFGLYAKAGLAYIQANRDLRQSTLAENALTTTTYLNTDNPSPPIGTTASNTPNEPYNQTVIYSKAYQAIRPTYGAGIDYTIPSTNADVEVFYNRIEGASAIPATSLWGIGVSYKFA